MKHAWIIIGWILVFGLGAWLRFDDLGSRPFHADEATGARITASRMMDEGGGFDPKHHHGPLLGDLATLVCGWRGERDWKSMTKFGLRCLPAAVGLLAVCLPLVWRKVAGESGSLLAASLVSVSPFLVYYSRMFIHEILLVTAGAAVLACFAGRRQFPVAAGIFLGLMFAAKETFAISVLAWTGAWGMTALLGGMFADRGHCWYWRKNFRSCLHVAVAAALVALCCYTRGFTHPTGAMDAVRTFFVYETTDGHDKHWWWYLVTFAWPQYAAGIWWLECLVLWFAALAFVVSLTPRHEHDVAVHWKRFLGFSVIGHLAIYSMIGYKTPWLMGMAWWMVCLLAGFGLADLQRVARVPSIAVAAAVFVGLLSLVRLARFANGRLSSDTRNPYAYVPTRTDVEGMAGFLDRLRPLADRDSIAVVGRDYWPLPWYLRSFKHAGYWANVPAGLEKWPFVLSMPETRHEVISKLQSSHIALPRGLRSGVPVVLLIRNDVWKRWMEGGR